MRLEPLSLDEYYGINKENPQSYYNYMITNLFNSINVAGENINMPDGMAKDIDASCKGYENKIKVLGGIDMQVLGIGGNGHIGL